MELATSLPAFLLAVLLISASPGPAMALIVRRAEPRGPAGAVTVGAVCRSPSRPSCT